MKIANLEEIIRQHVRLPSRVNTRGFHSVLCKVCNDHGKKGPRAGFKFDGGTVGYNCFNCGHSALFNPSEHITMPSKMVQVLDAFNIPESEWRVALYDAFVNDYNHSEAKPALSIEPAVIKLPPYFDPITDNVDDEWSQCAIDYIRNERGVEWTDHPFYIARKTDHPDSARWYGRFIIPIFKDGKLIFFQGRDLTGLHQRKYMSPNVPRDNVLSGYDRIFKDHNDPLYITEGWFDAYHLQGVAVFGNQFTPSQVKWINQSHRQKVVIPDRQGDGHLLATQAIQIGWSVSFPDIGSCKDVNDAVMKYGLLYTLKTIHDNTCSGFEAEARVGIYCEANKKRKI